MANSLAIIIGSALIAAAILFVFHWGVAISSGEPPVVRLNRWSGTVTACNVARDASIQAAHDHTALDLDCTAP
jgi:hypothetical protein